MHWLVLLTADFQKKISKLIFTCLICKTVKWSKNSWFEFSEIMAAQQFQLWDCNFCEKTVQLWDFARILPWIVWARKMLTRDSLEKTHCSYELDRRCSTKFFLMYWVIWLRSTLCASNHFLEDVCAKSVRMSRNAWYVELVQISKTSLQFRVFAFHQILFINW